MEAFKRGKQNMKQWICVLCCMALLCAMVGCAVEKPSLPSSESESDSSRERSDVSSFGGSLEDSSVEEHSENLSFGEHSEGSSGEELFSPSKNELGTVRVRRFINGKGLQDLSCEEAREFEDFLVSVGYRNFFLIDDGVHSILAIGDYWVRLSGFDFHSLQKEAELQNWYLHLDVAV